MAVAGSGCSLGAGSKPLCLGGECGRRGGAPDGPAPRPSRWHSLASLRASGGGRGQADHSLPGAPAAVSFPTVMSWQGRSQAQPRKTRRGTDGEAQPLTCAGWHLSEQRQTQAGTEAGRLDSVRGSLCTQQLLRVPPSLRTPGGPGWVGQGQVPLPSDPQVSWR